MAYVHGNLLPNIVIWLLLWHEILASLNAHPRLHPFNNFTYSRILDFPET